MRLGFLVAILIAGCAQPPVAQVAQAPNPLAIENAVLKAKLDAQADECARLDKQLNRTFAVAEKVKAETKYTGIILLTRPQNCPPCRRFEADMQGEPKRYGWTIGPGPQYHIWTKYSDGEVPVFQIVKEGVVIQSSVGYSGDVWRVLRLHPLFRPANNARRSESPLLYDGPAFAETVYEMPVYTSYTYLPTYAAAPVYAAPAYANSWSFGIGFGSCGPGGCR